MNESAQERNLDLNLLRVFVVVAETGAVTAAAKRLYLTQPAVSAALKRLAEAVGEPLFVREGRGIALTARGARLLATARPPLQALLAAALDPGTFDAATSSRTIRLGLADAAESWLLPPLLRKLAREAPLMRLVVLPVQFRTVVPLLTSGNLDLAVTVADETPPSLRREELFRGSFICLYDRRHHRFGRRHLALTQQKYLAARHIIVSYNGDLRGVVEDLFGLRREVRLSVASFHNIGAFVARTDLLATVPTIVAARELKRHKWLATAELPFAVPTSPTEALWRASSEDDPAIGFLRSAIRAIAP